MRWKGSIRDHVRMLNSEASATETKPTTTEELERKRDLQAMTTGRSFLENFVKKNPTFQQFKK